MFQHFYSLARQAVAVFLLAHALAYGAGPGTSAAPFLDLGFGARVSALGEAVVAMADDPSTIYYNPAGLAGHAPAGTIPLPRVAAPIAPRPARGQSPQGYELLMSHSLHLQEIRVTQFGLLRRPYAVHLTHLGISGIERRSSESIAPEGSFGASDLALSVSHGRRIGALGAGASLRVIRQTIGERSAMAYAVDLSLLRRFSSRPVSVGLGVMNIGTPVRFVERAYPLPMTVRLGATYGLSARFPHALSAQLDLPRDSVPVLRLSLEYLGFGPLALRAGYRTQSGAQREAALGKQLGTTASGLSEFYGMFMGVGFHSRLGTLDYSITPYGELGSSHRFSVGFRFGGPMSGTAARAQGQ